MECVVCYNNIKKSFVPCHSLCKKCYNKIQNKKCPICRQNILMVLKENNNKLIEVEHLVKGEVEMKTIHACKLKKYVFSKSFKDVLERRLKGDWIKFKDYYCIINWKKYEYHEIVDKKDIHVLYGSCYCEYQIISWLDKIFIRNPLSLKDIFLINNYVTKLNSNEFAWSNPSRRVMSFIWNKVKPEYTGL